MPIWTMTPAPPTPESGDNYKKAQVSQNVKFGVDPAVPYARGGRVSVPLMRKAQLMGASWNAVFAPPQIFNPINTPQQWQIASKRREIYQWSRHWYENEPKVAAGIDFYAQFPMCGFKLECKRAKLKRYYEKLVEDLKLNYWLKYIAHEYYVLGDVFPFLEIECPHCGGGGVDEDGEPCMHKDGKFRRIECINPDYIEVVKTHLADKPEIYMIPDEQLKMIVQKKVEPIFSRLPQYVKECVAGNRPIKLSSRSCSHIRHNASPYGVYGTSLLRRLFTTLAYKTKLMTANWIIAERLVLPIRVVKIGDKERPATAEDIQDMQQNLAAVAQDPNLTIVTHHAAEFDWVGATGKIHNIQGELELIGKEILDGFMLNQALLNGEMGHYSSAQVGVEAILHRLESWRNTLADWVYEHIFKPTAMMQGFVDEEATRELQAATDNEDDVVYMYPKIKWNNMQLRDNTQQMQLNIQLNQEGKMSNETLLKFIDLDWDEEVEKMRNEQATVGAGGQMMQQGGAGGGGMGGGGGGGGMDPSGGMGADPTGGMGMGMDPTGGMGGGGGGMGAAGGMGGGGGGMGAAASAQPSKIYKRGKGPKDSGSEEQMPQQQMTQIKLTKLEQKVYKAIQQLDIPYKLFGQFKVQVPGGQQPYSMDFAFPAVKVDIEADGRIWHEDDETGDAERDQRLAQLGWRVLRFKEEAINEHLDQVSDIIYAQVYDASESSKKKTASAESPESVHYTELYGSDGKLLLGVIVNGV